jgi:hypothetical protein
MLLDFDDRILILPYSKSIPFLNTPFPSHLVLLDLQPIVEETITLQLKENLEIPSGFVVHAPLFIFPPARDG